MSTLGPLHPRSPSSADALLCREEGDVSGMHSSAFCGRDFEMVYGTEELSVRFGESLSSVKPVGSWLALFTGAPYAPRCCLPGVLLWAQRFTSVLEKSSVPWQVLDPVST